MNNAIQHVAIIMDGNGRWAAARGLPRIEGHKAGAEAVKRAIRAGNQPRKVQNYKPKARIYRISWDKN